MNDLVELAKQEKKDGDEDQSEYRDLVIDRDPSSVARVMHVANEDGTMRKIIRAPKSEFVHQLLHLNGEKFDFSGRDYFKPIYDGNDSQTLLKTARQVEKTTFLGNNMVILSVVRPFNKCLYVSPSFSQTRQFSNEKLKPVIEQSPLIKRYFTDSFTSAHVLEKSFTQGSYIFLRSCFRTADRARGISARHLFLDEIQDLLISEIPVIAECTSHFVDSTTMMAGTPKSYDNPIEVYWNESTQNEWLVKCPHCGHFNFLDERNTAPTQMYLDDILPPGPVCKKCMKPIDVRTGKWMPLSPKKMIKGYRIPQLMVPWIVGIKSQWLKLLWKRDNYPTGQFQNEVLGLSYDSASKPITRDELIECCDASYHFWPSIITAQTIQEAKKFQLIGGVDWGEGNDGADRTPTGKLRNASYTVFSIGAYTSPNRFKILFMKKYVGQETDPDFIVNDIARICLALDVKLLGVDWGHGWGVNNHLVRMLGPQKVVQFQHLPKLKERIKWDPIGFRYHLSRNLIISEFFYCLKQQQIIFPSWKEFEPFAKDILAVFVEYIEYRREMRYDHRPSDPDDSMHSLLYAWQAANIYFGRKPRT